MLFFLITNYCQIEKSLKNNLIQNENIPFVKKKRSKYGNIKKIQKYILFDLPILLIEIYPIDTFVYKK